jgi:hypothetical protein
MAVKFSQFSIGTASATAYVVGYDGSSNVRIPATALSPSGTPGYLPKYASPSGLANSLIFDNGTSVGINTASPSSGFALDVNGFLRVVSGANIAGMTVGLGNGSISDNMAIGVSVLGVNTSGFANTSVGYFASNSNTSGSRNVAIGAYSMQVSTAANNNVSIGWAALSSLTAISGNTDNVAIGQAAMQTKTGVLGAGNVAVGTLSLAEGGGTGGSNNVAIGTQALRTLQSGTRNVAVGYQSQRFNVSGTNNVSLGWQGLYNVTGSQNVGIGYLSGYLITTGSNNVVIGGNSGSSINTLSNFMLFADGAGNERFRIPSTGNVLIGTTTDAGYKLDVNGTARVRESLFMLRSDAAATVEALKYGTGNTVDIGTTFRVTGTNQWNNTTSSTSYIQNGYTTKNFVSTPQQNGSFSSFDFSNSGEFAPTIPNPYTQKLIHGAITINSTAATNNFHGVSISATDNSASIANNVFAVYADATLGTNTSATRWAGYFLGRGYFSQVLAIGTTSPNASALLDVSSTAKGFLPPRMTTAQINAISTPAEGLIAYNTTISHLCVYQAGAWVRINHSPM